MLALLRKEAREALLGLVLLSVLLSSITIRAGIDIVVPARSLIHLVVAATFAVAIGVCLGFAEFAIEERNTWRYLVFRSTGYRGAFVAKLTLDWSVLALLTIVPLCAHAVWVVWFTDDAEIALWNRYLEVITAAAVGVGAHAIGVFAAQLRRPIWLRFTIALAGAAGLLVESSLVTQAPYGAAFGPAARYLLGIASISLPLYAVSYRMFVAGIDDDRAFSRKLGVGVYACALAVLAPCTAFVVGAIQSVPVGNIAAECPSIVQVKDGGLRLAAFVEGRAFEVGSRDSQPRVPIYDVRRIIPLFASTSWSPWTEEMLLRANEPMTMFEFGAAWRSLMQQPHIGLWPTWGDAWLAKRGGRIAVVQHRDSPSSRRLLLLGKGAEGGEFSALAGAIGPLDSHKFCVVDPQDRSLWFLDPDAAEPKLERIELPNHDEFLRVDRMVLTDEPGPGKSIYRVDDVTVVIGAHGIYEWKGDHFVDGARNGLWLPSADAAASAKLRVELTTPDALEPAVVVRDATTGAALIEYTHTNVFDMRAAIACACSLVRPTIGSIVSTLRDVPPNLREIYLLTDPLLTGGRRLWLLALNVLLSAALAARAWRRGTVGDPRRVFETLAILLLGVPAFAVLALVEPRRRAARKVIVATAPREQLLISSV